MLEDNTPPPQNAVPYGQGGSPAVPYSAPQFHDGHGGATQAGMGFQRPGGGDFGRAVFLVRGRGAQPRQQQWLQSTVDPSVAGRRAPTFRFEILRNGTVTNVQMLQSSGKRSVDNSAVRAILSSSPLQPLPGDYSGGNVSVEFWFDFRRSNGCLAAGTDAEEEIGSENGVANENLDGRLRSAVISSARCCAMLLCAARPASAQDWFNTGTGLGVSKARVAVADFCGQDATSQPLATTFQRCVRTTWTTAASSNW